MNRLSIRGLCSVASLVFAHGVIGCGGLPPNRELNLGDDAHRLYADAYVPPPAAPCAQSPDGPIAAPAPAYGPINSEEHFAAVFYAGCAIGAGASTLRSGIDFDKHVLAVFSETADATAPVFDRLVEDGDKIVAVFRVTRYCGGPPPPRETTTVMFLLPAAKSHVRLETRTYENPSSPACPKGPLP